MKAFYFLSYMRRFGAIIGLGTILVACGSGHSSKPDTRSSNSSNSLSSSTSSISSTSSTESSAITSSSSNSSSSSINSTSSSSSLFSAASSSSFTSSSVATKQTGILVDSAVAGIHYETSPNGFSGYTTVKGEYQYAEGDTLIFSIGSLTFPAVTAKAIVTPLDIANSSDSQNRVALNIAALLQSLDTDGDADNGISINYDLAAAHASAVNFDLPYETFAALPAVVNLTANSGSSNKALLSQVQALTHMQTSLRKINAAPFIGTWYAQVSNSHYVLFILDTSHYVALTYEGSGASIEHGTYTWDQQSTKLTTNKKDFAGTTTAKTPFVSNVLLTTTSDTINIANSNGQNIALSKLESNSLIGGWSGLAGNNVSVVAFTDTHYFHGQHGNNAYDHAGNLTGTSGAEYGTYSNSSEFTVKTLADTNLQWGFSHPCNVVESHRNQQANDLSCMSGNAAYTLNASRNILTLYSGANAIANQTNPYPYNNNPLYYYFDRVTQNEAEIYGFPSPLNGFWTGSDGHDTFIFSGYNQFTHIKSFSDDPENCKAGTATGTYTWDATTGAFNVALVSDTTVTEAAGSCSIEGLSTLKLDGNTLKLTTEGEFIFTRK